MFWLIYTKVSYKVNIAEQIMHWVRNKITPTQSNSWKIDSTDINLLFELADFVIDVEYI